jgi:Fe-S cluster assembly iron-binding protein IscA
MVDGIRTDPIGPQLDITNGVWHTLAVRCQGNQLTFRFDGRLIMPPLQDNTFAEGKIGFWTKSDAVSYFSDPVIDYTPRIPMAQTLVKNIMEKQPRILGLRIYALDDKGGTHIIASKDESETGQPGTDAEKKAVTDGAISYGREKGVDTIVLPFRDRNGDPMAAVRVKLKSFIGETQQNALIRANMILKSMQAEVTSSDQLMQ